MLALWPCCVVAYAVLLVRLGLISETAAVLAKRISPALLPITKVCVPLVVNMDVAVRFWILFDRG